MTIRSTRRAVLGGCGVALALPWLESFVGPRAARAAPGDLPRLVTFFVPNGLPLEMFTPAAAGADWESTPLLDPLAAHRSSLVVVSGVMGVGGPDSHAAGICAFSTGQACTTLGAGGPSIEQVAAAHGGDDTPLRSLTVAVQDSGQWSSNGYSSACFTNTAWSAAETPLPPERDPALLFMRLFGDGTPDAAIEAERRAAYRHSVIDNVKSDLARLQGKLGSADRARLEIHLEAVRALEMRIDATIACTVPPPPAGNPSEIWESGYYRRAKLLMDLLAMALACGSTRYASFMLCDGAGNGGPDTEQDIAGQHHEIAHAGDREAMRRFSEVHMRQLAYFLDRLAASSEGDGSVLDHSLVMLGTELGDGTGHTANDLPFVLAGGASGAIETGRHIAVAGAPVAALHLTCLQRCGIDVDTFAGTTDVIDVL